MAGDGVDGCDELEVCDDCAERDGEESGDEAFDVSGPVRLNAFSPRWTSGSSNVSGAFSTGPRRLTSRTDNVRRDPCDLPVDNVSLSGAGEAWYCAAAGRIRKVRPLDAAATDCSRRNASCRASVLSSGNQATSAPKAELFRLCSIAHNRSAGRSVRTISTRRMSMPSCSQPVGSGTCGGASNTISRPACVNDDSVDARKRISPTPVCDSSSSVRQRDGQPPPGSSSSSVRKPLGVEGSGEADNASPRQNWPASPASRNAASVRSTAGGGATGAAFDGGVGRAFQGDGRGGDDCGVDDRECVVGAGGTDRRVDVEAGTAGIGTSNETGGDAGAGFDSGAGIGSNSDRMTGRDGIASADFIGTAAPGGADMNDPLPLGMKDDDGGRKGDDGDDGENSGSDVIGWPIRT